MVTLQSYSEVALPQLHNALEKNEKVFSEIEKSLLTVIENGGNLFVFGSGHSAMFSMELFHRAGGASFVIPIFADFLMAHAGPSVVRVMERTEKIVEPLVARSGIGPKDMIWIMSQSGINPVTVDMAEQSKKRGAKTVAWTSVSHSSSVKSRHSSGKRLFEVCDYTVDLMGVRGDAAVSLNQETSSGPLSSLTAIFLANSLLTKVCFELEKNGVRCVYTSVNTPEGEARNKDLEKKASERCLLLKE